ncbi:MAG: DUF1501 domain-containing protein [Planctomycetes bacterium]|nr:DUF1501 domain-containing protein [Planctomycetota bacterium]
MNRNDSLDSELRRQLARFAARRTFLKHGALSLGAIALQSLLRGEGRAQAAAGAGEAGGGAAAGASTARPLVPRSPPLPARVKQVISIHLSGAPPQHDLFDWKPKLVQHHLQPCPEELLQGQRFAFIQGRPLLLGSPYRFAQHGQSGAWMSELLPNLATVADRLCIVRSMRTTEFNHAPAELFLHTGDRNAGHPALGSWVTWGLGSENQDLPGFVVLVSGGTDPTAGKSVWSSGFLPSVHQGVQCRSGKEPVFFLNDPAGMPRTTRRATLDALNRLNELEHATTRDPETLTRISQYELAFRMQQAVPEVMDLAKEEPATLEEYGAKPGVTSLASHCLLARRMVESGVRFVQLFDWGWDVHGTSSGDDIVTQLPMKCREMDRPVAALIRDLERRGLLDSTLVIWGGEFGRTAMNEARGGSKFLGRDHHPHCFTMFLAGAGIKAGAQVGATDELGWSITDTPIDVHDLQATLLHLLGFDPHRLSYPYLGLDQRLIGPAETPRVRHELLA